MVTNWTKSSMPWFEIDEFAAVIVDKAKFLDILDHYGIEYMACSSGEFTHKMKCPLPNHAGGNERTASCYFSETKNKFYCYGCNSGSNIIDFVSLYSGRPFYESMRWIAEFAHIIDASGTNIPKKIKRDTKQTVAYHAFHTGAYIRDFVASKKNKKEYNKWCHWADERFVELDGYMDNLSDGKWEIVKTYYEKVSKFLKGKI